MRGKNSASDVMPPVFGLPPAIQKISSKQASARAAASALVALEFVDEQHRAAPADLLHAVREAGKRAQARLDRRGVKPERQRRRSGAGGVLRIVRATQRADAAKLRAISRVTPAVACMIFPMLGVDAVGQRPQHRHAHHALAGAVEPVGDGRAPIVVDADDGGAIALHAGDQPLLDRRVVLHACRGGRDDPR